VIDFPFLSRPRSIMAAAEAHSSDLVIRATPLEVKPAPESAVAAAAAAPAAAAAKPHGPPPFLPFILAVVLPIVYGLLAAPLFQSAANPDVNVPRLPVLVCSFDTPGPSGSLNIGAAFSSFWAANGGGSQIVPNNGALAITLPGIQVVQSADYSPADLVQQVKDAKVFAAIYVNANASAALANALSSPAAAAAYDPSTAITIVWDEARNNVVTTARIGGPLKGLLVGFSTGMAKATLGAWLAAGEPNKAAFAAVANGQGMRALSNLLALPVYYSENSVFPFTVPAINIALTVGQILLCVFGLITTNVTWGPVGLIPYIRSAMPGVPLALRRTSVILLITCMIGVAYATILIGIGNASNITKNAQNLAPGVTFGATGAAGFFSGAQWAQLWSLAWLESLVFALYLCIPVVFLGDPAIAGALLGPMIVRAALRRRREERGRAPSHRATRRTQTSFRRFSTASPSPPTRATLASSSSVGNNMGRNGRGSCAKPRRQCRCVFAESTATRNAHLIAHLPPLSLSLRRADYAPMWHTGELVRTIMFGTLTTRVGMHVGVLFLWLIVELALFIGAHVIVARRQAAAAAAKAVAVAAPPAPAAAAAPAAVADAPVDVAKA